MRPWHLAVMALLVSACEREEAQAVPGEAVEAAAAHDLSDRSALARHEGLYGASHADCDPDNLYMDEYVELFDQGFAYRGELSTLAEIMGGGRFRFTNSEGVSEVVEVDGEELVRSPDDRARRTVYLRCR
ncbi:hypothetical protein [Sphingomicrobium lutaoense]|uniref:Lipoprotein n=1 Tax=Sphingomicrobium lutaoense TaxID=515949 RepID=A0A839YY57_9SPHN|nr:hypothetical protein [Sphingomicrobium lutaoense]MBB3763248.1 hypothetical protein [Sphingomicrobium lutaoense]